MTTPVNSAPITLRLIPDISAAALRQHQDKQAALWYLLRALDLALFGHNAHIDKGYVLSALPLRFGYSLRTLERHLSEGEGVWWETYAPRPGRIMLEIRGLQAVCRSLGTALETDRHFRKVSSSEFDTPIKRKAQIYASIHKPAGVIGNPISRHCITEYTGLTKRTQRHLERVARVRRVANYAMVRDVGGTLIPEKLEVYTRTHCYELDRRLPNSYRTQQEPDVKGMLRNTSKKLRPLITDEAQQLTKRYFTGIGKLTKALSSRGEGAHLGLYKVAPNERSVYGRQEWVSCLICV